MSDKKADKSADQMTPTTMGDLLNDNNIPPKVGDIVEGVIMSSGKNEVYIDLGPLGVGIVRGREIFDVMDSQGEMKAGARVPVTIIDLENELGYVELSLKQAGQEKAWEELKGKYKNNEVFSIKVADANKGGLIVFMYGIPAFMPVSQLTTEHYPRVEGGDKNEILKVLKSFVRKELKVKIIDLNQDEEKIILSEKAAIAEEKRGEISSLKVGDMVEGKVSGIVDFGVFVKFGDGIEGLVHISELAWQKVESPEDIVKIGDSVKAKIIGVEGTRISLSIKQLKDDPWAKDVKKYKVGQIIEGKITKINPFGAFVQLDDKIHGLAHVSELGDMLKTESKNPLKEGDTTKFKILSIEPQDHRLGLALVKDGDEKGKKKEVKKEKEDKAEKKADPEKKPKKEKTEKK